MNEKTTRNLLTTLVVLVAAGLIYFLALNVDDEPVPRQSANSQTTPAQEPVETDGKIAGSFTYPGESIPSEMSACVEDSVTREKIVCSEQQIKDDERFIYGVGYEVTVPAGKYYVYVDQGDTKAYFNGYTARVDKEDGWPDYDNNKCKSEYQPIVVTVEAGKTTDGATLADWYYEANCN